MMTFDFSKRILCSLLLLASAWIFSSCGYYHAGSLMHPQIKTIALADVRNNTREPLLTEIMRQKLAEEVMVDGSLKLVDKESADCIMYCEITQVQNQVIFSTSTDGQQTFRPKEYRVRIIGEFQVIVPGRSEPLIPRRQVSGDALYQYEGDPQLSKFSGLKLASSRFAKMAVQYTTEAW